MSTPPKTARATINRLTPLLAVLSVLGAGPAHAQVATTGNVTNGAALVTPGTQPDPFNTGPLVVGSAPVSGTLSIVAGGTVNSDGNGTVANSAGGIGIGTVLVSGTGSKWAIGTTAAGQPGTVGQLFVGNATGVMGVLTIFDGGSVVNPTGGRNFIGTMVARALC